MKECDRHVKKPLPIGFLTQSELFEMTKLIAIMFIANFYQLSIDSRKDEKISRNLTSNHCMLMEVLTHKKSLIFTESNRMLFDRAKKNF